MTATFDSLQLADYATEMVSLHDDDGRFLSCSAVCHDLLGYAGEDLAGRRLSDLVHPEDAHGLETAFRGAPGEPRSGAVAVTCRLRHAEGYWAWAEVTVRPAPGTHDGSTIVSTHGAGELMAARQSADWAQETLREVFDHAPTAIAMLGPDGRFERANPAFCALLDTSADLLVGRTLASCSDGGDSPTDRFALAELTSGRVEAITGTHAFLRGGRTPVTASVRRSISHTLTGRQQVVLHVLAVHDPDLPATPPHAGPGRSEPSRVEVHTLEGVTGLTSRPLLLDRLRLAAGRPERDTHFLVMFFVDIRGAARILDRHGRRSLEGLLTLSGNRLRTTVRTEDTVARFNDHGFVVLCPVVANGADVLVIRQRLAEAVADGAMSVDGRKFTVSAAVGAAIVGPGEAADPELLLSRADEAMAAAR